MGYQLGIDLGTTYSAAAVCRAGDGRRVEPEVVTLGSRAATVPSVLYIGDDGSVLVGEAAERRAVSDPDRVVREFKRRIGDPTPVVVAGSPWAAEELAARLVRWIVDQVAAREGGPADRIAVTHPASWGAHKKELLTGALACHGLQVTFLAEPQAAALHYASAERVEPGSTIAVYDLGGGTFDAAVLRKGAAADEAGFGLLGRPEGIAQLGGIDFDQAVFDHVVAGTPGAFDDLDDTDPAVLGAVSRLRRECTEAKETLSSDTEASVPVLLPGTQGSVRLHRGEFEQMIRPHVEETVTALRRAVESAGLTPDQLSAVLLVGGSSRIPLVAQLVSEQVGRPVAVDTDPKNTIAKGAALAVSPQPASWPAVTMRPVEATGPVAPAAGVALLAAPAAAAVWAPVPTANPLPPANPVPAPVPMPVPAAMHLPPPPPRRGPAGPPMPPPRPSISSDWEREPAAPQRKRGPVGLLVGVGGVLAVAAVVVAVLTWPTASPATAGSSLSGQSTAEAQAEPTGGPVSPVSNPVVNANAESNGGQAQQQQPAGNGSKPAANAPAPVVKPPAGPVVAPAGPTSPAPVVQPPVVPPVAPPAPPVNPPVDPGTPPGGGTTDPGTGTPGGGTTDPGTGTPGGGTTDPGTTGGIADGGATPPAGGSTGGSPSGGTTSAPPAP